MSKLIVAVPGVSVTECASNVLYFAFSFLLFKLFRYQNPFTFALIVCFFEFLRAHIEEENFQYLFHDNKEVTLMNTSDYSQFVVEISVFAIKKKSFKSDSSELMPKKSSMCDSIFAFSLSNDCASWGFSQSR